MENNFTIIWKCLAFYNLKYLFALPLKVCEKDIMKRNQDFMQVRKIKKLEYLLRQVRLSDCDTSDSNGRTVLNSKLEHFSKSAEQNNSLIPVSRQVFLN
jgi:hypothetical protein